jgi:predicted alpha/beta-fold hydrolase
MKGPDLPPFEERFPWWGGDLQTLATALLPGARDVGPYVSERRRFTLADGDILFASLDQPIDPRAGQPLVILIHGVPGSESSPYIIRMARYLLMRGYYVLRLNLRGAGESRAHCRKQYYAGSSGDIVELLSQLPPELTQSGVAAVGYSLGGAILLKYLGEQGSRTPICAAISVSAPIDLLDASRNLTSFRNSLYHWYIFRRIKREATAKGAELTTEERKAIEASSNLLEYDDRFTGPRNKYKGAADYYEACSAMNFLVDIRTPTLVLAALDDPWVSGSAYSSFYWRSNPSLSLVPLLPAHGGHVGFHGVGFDRSWSDLAVAGFLRSVRPFDAWQ